MKTDTTLRRLIATTLIGSFASSLCIAAQADVGPAPQIVVKYGDLDISHQSGAQALYHRIWAAAVTVCRPWTTAISSHEIA